MIFANLIKESANQYLDFIETSPTAAKKIIEVKDIARRKRIRTQYYLLAHEKISFSYSVQIYVKGKHVDSIQALKYSKTHSGTHLLLVDDRDDILSKIPNLRPSDIAIVSDLSFLIRRMRDFYESHSLCFSPPDPPLLPELPDTLTETLSAEQLAAVNGACSSPLSFISGAPGTGKTRMVLSRCVLRYILDNKKVLLLAPTNNAVEQMLRGILPVLKDSGIPLRAVYRTGISSEEFAMQYPEVVGDSVLEEQYNELSSQYQYLQEKITDLERAAADLHILRVALHRLKPYHARISALLHQCLQEQAVVDTAQKELDLSYYQLSIAKAQHKKAADARKQAQVQLSATQRILSDKNAEYRRLPNFLWWKKRRIAISAELVPLLSVIPQYQQQYDEASAEDLRCAAAYKDANMLTASAQVALSSAKKQHSQTTQTVNGLLTTGARSADPVDPEYRTLALRILSDNEASVQALENHVAKRRQEVAILEEKLTANDLTTLKSELEQVRMQFSKLNSDPKLEQKNNALVLAGTIDSSLDDLIPRDDHKQISHVFLDEAGYTSLARGMAVFACRAPVTFLGDHHQLPPICEMNQIYPNNAPVCLWALSIAYYHECLYGGLESLYLDCYEGREDPSFRSFSHYSLNESYRFGPELAKVLAKYIYSHAFQGLSKKPLEVVVLDAPFGKSTLKNSSLSEAHAIAQYLEEHDLSDFAVLTPYRGQLKLLQQQLPTYREHILTVHRSQGREWDTVILSVTDVNKPFFTDSNTAIGKSVLNTAISRTKHRLVIVCDVKVWKARHNQMITELLNLHTKDVGISIDE